MIYADNAATTRLDIEAFEAMKPFLLENYANASQAYSFARSAKKAIKEARETIALVIGAKPGEIYFTSGGTESDNWAIKAIMLSSSKKNEIITSEIEHHAVLHSVDMIKKMGFSVKYLPVNSQGIVCVEKLCNMMSDKTKLVSVMMSNNEVGTIEPIKKLASIAHSWGAIFHTDAVQSVGHIDIDVKGLDVDLLSASAHKFNGPKGIGFLYVREGIDIEPFNDGGAQEYGKRAGTENVAAIVGMATALKRNWLQIKENTKYLHRLESSLLGMLNEAGIEYLKNGSTSRIPGTLSLSFKGVSGELLLHRLDLMGICISTGSACDSQNTQISHVLRAMRIPEEYALGTIRVSLGKDNTEEDVERIGKCLIKILETSCK